MESPAKGSQCADSPPQLQTLPPVVSTPLGLGAPPPTRTDGALMFESTYKSPAASCATPASYRIVTLATVEPAERNRPRPAVLRGKAAPFAEV
jgi:hypothetical protein